MKDGDKVRVIAEEAEFNGREGVIAGKGLEGYDFQVRFPDALWLDDTYFFNESELQLLKGKDDE